MLSFIEKRKGENFMGSHEINQRRLENSGSHSSPGGNGHRRGFECDPAAFKYVRDQMQSEGGESSGGGGFSSFESSDYKQFVQERIEIQTKQNEENARELAALQEKKRRETLAEDLGQALYDNFVYNKNAAHKRTLRSTHPHLFTEFTQKGLGEIEYEKSIAKIESIADDFHAIRAVSGSLHKYKI
jgi:hypothetical protein